jgi:hypothetical protein
MPDTNDWNADHLNRLSSQDEIHLSSIRRDGAPRKPVTMWMVTDDGHVYVRSVKGVDGTWYRHVRATDLAHIAARGVDADVSVEDASTDAALANRLDTAYQTKYQRYAQPIVDSVLTPAAKASTLRLTPRG